MIHRRLISEGDGSAATTSATAEGAGPPPAKAKKTAETSVEKAEGSSETGEKSGDGGETSSSAAGTAAAAAAVDDKYEYYVHYSGFNRRLDEWVRRDRVKLADQDVKEVNLDPSFFKVKSKPGLQAYFSNNFAATLTKQPDS